MSPDNNLTLGEFLRQERERRGITIEQVASATKINVRLLHSLEADHYADLPAKPFVRGFVTSYCRFVGMNPREILTRFGDFVDRKAFDRPNREAGHSGYAFEKREGEQSRTMLWFIMGGFVVFGGITLVVLKPSLKHQRSSHADKLRIANGASPGVSPSVSPSMTPSSSVPISADANVKTLTPRSLPSPAFPSPKPSSVAVAAATATSPTRVTPSPQPSPVKPLATATPSPSPAPPLLSTQEDPLSSGLDLKKDEIRHKILFKAQQDVWVRYQVDQKKVMRFIIRQGRVLVLRAKESIRFQTSDPSNIEYSYNGKAMMPVAKTKSGVVKKGDLTLLVPFETLKIIEDPFPGEKPLTGRTIPSPKASPAISTPSP